MYTFQDYHKPQKAKMVYYLNFDNIRLQVNVQHHGTPNESAGPELKVLSKYFLLTPMLNLLQFKGKQPAVSRYS